MADGLQALLLYHSVTGNTEKVAQALQQGLEDEGCRVTVRRVE